MKLNWFSPVPPAHTAIAHYTAHVLPALAQRAAVTVWTDQTECDAAIEGVVPVQRYHPERILWAELNYAQMNVYHIGNNPLFHDSIWDVSRRQPGIVVLHDLRLQHFFAALYRNRGDRQGYLAAVRRFYGADGEGAAAQSWDGAVAIEYMAEHYPLTPLAVEGALGVLVHTREAFAVLQEAQRQPVAYAPLPYAATVRTRLPAVRRTEPPYHIVTFGHIGPNRRLDVVLRALAEFPDRRSFRLDVYGRLWNVEAVRAQLRSLGIAPMVALHGFVPQAQLNRALVGADLAINLRDPTMGEASFSQLQIWDHALPSLVTRAGWYASLSENAVAFVRPGHESLDIQAHLRAFLANPLRFAAMGAAGRRILEEEHTPQAYAQAMVDLAADAERFRPRGAAWTLARRAGTEMSVWVRPSAPRTSFGKVAEEIYALTNGTIDPTPRRSATTAPTPTDAIPNPRCNAPRGWLERRNSE